MTTALRKVDFLAAVPEKELVELGSGARTHVYGAGKHILREGDVGEEMLVLLSGAVQAWVPEADGEAVVLLDWTRVGASV